MKEEESIEKKMMKFPERISFFFFSVRQRRSFPFILDRRI